jgi:Tfp pilus assembly protein PilF
MRAKALAVLTICLGLAFCASSQNKIQQKQQKDPKYQYNLGLYYLNQNDVENATRSFTNSVALDQGYYLSWNGLGLAHSMKGRLDEAVKAYEKCLQVNPQFTEAHNNLGTVYQEKGQLDRAEKEFQKAIADLAYTNRELPYFNLARLYVVQDRLDEALDNVQKALHLKPRLAMALNLRGLIYEKKNIIPEAVASYEAAVKAVPEDLNFSYNLAVAYFKNEDYSRAREIFLRIQGKVTDAEIRDTIARYLRLIGDR